MLDGGGNYWGNMRCLVLSMLIVVASFFEWPSGNGVREPFDY